jgi:hypothetical protein
LGKFNCPSCNKRYDDLADLVQHLSRAHKLRDKYLIVNRHAGDVWLENRLPSALTTKAKEKATSSESEPISVAA